MENIKNNKKSFRFNDDTIIKLDELKNKMGISNNTTIVEFAINSLYKRIILNKDDDEIIKEIRNLYLQCSKKVVE